MLCECGENEATIHEVVIRNGKPYERHLCEACAAKQGIKTSPSVPTGELLAKYVLSKTAKPAQETACPECGLTFSEFKQSELLGCPSCYRAFEDKLGPLLERTHEGGTHHVGKIPRHALERSRLGGASGSLDELLGNAEAQAERLAALRRKLDEAVTAERFELAAQIRDEIQRTGGSADG
jgi:protein arginine kinase activator